MAGLILSNRKNGARDPFSLARELFDFEPFAWPRAEAAKSGFVPTFNVIETPEGFVLEADLPGVAESDIAITLEKDTLVISGSRSAAEKKETDSYHLVERRYGKFERRFKLPELADGDNVTANLANGVLTVKVPKRPEVAPRTIEIKTS